MLQHSLAVHWSNWSTPPRPLCVLPIYLLLLLVDVLLCLATNSPSVLTMSNNPQEPLTAHHHPAQRFTALKNMHQPSRSLSSPLLQL